MKKLVLLFSLFVSTWISISTFSYAQSSIFDTSTTFFSNDKEFLRVDEAFVFDYYQNGNRLIVSFNVKDGYYLYKHQFKFTPENAEIAEVQLPKGIEHKDEYFGLTEIYQKPIDLVINVNEATAGATLNIRYQGCAKKGLCYPPETKIIELNPVTSSTKNSASTQDILSGISQTPTSSQQNAADSELSDNANNKKKDSSNKVNNINKSEQFELADMLANDSLLLTLLAFFVLGLGLSFTPCVFPMYPILTGIIVGQGDKLSNKKAFSLSFFYVQGMALTYTALGVVVALAGAQFQAMFQHPVILIGLSVLFIFLALSMFGVFNLALPASWQNKLNNLSNSQKGGSITGVLAMGAISGLVASPCTTAPLTGALIFIAESGDIVTGASALYALSLGMGLPLLILGSSGGKLLPKAGAWMNVIKNIFGILLLAVPVLLLERFIPHIAADILWSLLLLGAGGYFYIANSQTDKNFFHGLRFVIIFALLFFGANKLYQTLLPNSTTAAYQAENQHHFKQVENLTELYQAIAKANQQGKTVMLDLYADWCVACIEFEEKTFPKANVQQALANTVQLQIDLTDTGTKPNKALMKEFEVFGLPSILFFDLNGQELTNKRVTGFQDDKEFTAHLKTFL